MLISSLYIENVRCLKKANICLGERVNLFVGENGSGKSSILEAIHIMATGKSFRTSKIDGVKKFDSEGFIISSIINRNGYKKTIGYRKDRSNIDIRVDATNVSRLSELVFNFSLLAFHSNSVFIIEGEPQYRRRYIDWWLFQSNTIFYPEWLRYQNLLKQRNSALRQSNSFLDVWDEALAESGEIINSLRKSAAQLLMEEVRNVIYEGEFRSLYDFSWQYNSGWPKEENFLSALKRNQHRDVIYGFTSVGVHRGDLRITFKGKDAKEYLSRGQQKTLSLIMLIALISIHKKVLNETPIFLIDDISSELDAEHSYKLVEKIIDFGGQLILTSIAAKDIKFPTSTPVNTFVLQKGDVHVV